MSSTNLAYAVIGTRIPITYLFDYDPPQQGCHRHGPQSGSYCPGCGNRLDVIQVSRPNAFFQELAKNSFGCNADVLWGFMTEKADSINTPAPLAWWMSDYPHSGFRIAETDRVVLGIEVAKTPFHGFDDYPVADVKIGNLLDVSRTVGKELLKFGIRDLPLLFVFSYV